MAYPLLYVALSYILGSLAAATSSVPFGAWAICVLASLFLAWAWFNGESTLPKSWGALLLVVFFIGAGRLSHENQTYHTNSLHKLRYKEYLDIEGILSRSPQPRSDRDLLYVRVQELSFLNQHFTLQGNLRVSVPRSQSAALPSGLLVGDRLRISARLLAFPGFHNFGADPRELPYQILNIHRLASTKSPLLVERLATGNPWSLIRAVSGLRARFQTTIETQFQIPGSKAMDQRGAVLEALLLGERGRLSNTTIRLFQASGLFHLLALSGAHTAILIFVLLGMLRWLRLPDTGALISVLALLLLFVLLVEGRPSVVRAAVMAGLYLTGKTLCKDVHLLNTLALAALVLLFLNPLQIFDLGFQLTFTATLTIVLFLPNLRRILPRLPFRQNEILAVTLAAQVGVLPLAVRAFNRVIFLALFLNGAAIPLVACIMTGGYGLLVSSMLFPSLSQPAALLIKPVLQLFLGLAQVGASMPWGSFRVPTPSSWMCGFFWICCACLLVPRRFKAQPAVLIFGVAASLALLTLSPLSRRTCGLTVSFIDVGHGDAILVELPGGETMLVDGGGQRTGDFDIGERVVSPFLWRKGIRRVDYIVSTHPHPDHCQGLQAVIRNFKVDELWESLAYPEETSYRMLHQNLPQGLVIQRFYRGDIQNLKEVRVQVLHPPRLGLSPREPNRNSLVLRLVYGRTAILLTGDIDATAEKDIQLAFRNIQSGVLKSPHHGSRTSSSRAFLFQTDPKIVVISTGRGLKGLPAPDTLKRYAERQISIYRTDIHGTVEIKSDGDAFSVRTAVPIPAFKQ